jgi:hypothetical protein
MKIIKKIVVLFFLYVIIVIGIPYGIMKFSSFQNYHNSFLKEENIVINMKAGKKYYPFILNYDPSLQFSNLRNEDIDLDIYYNFGSLGLNGKSLVYLEKSDYYTAFYGAYAVRYNENKKDLSNNYEEIIQITNFDLKTLVLKSIGDKEPFVNYQIDEFFSYIDINGLNYKVVDTNITIDGFAHQYQKFYKAYIQYGVPYKTDKSFVPIESVGRMYIHYDDIKNINIILYIIAPNEQSLNFLEENFIFSTKISNLN